MASITGIFFKIKLLSILKTFVIVFEQDFLAKRKKVNLNLFYSFSKVMITLS